MGSAGFDRDEDHWPRRWAEAYVDFAAGEKRAWLRRAGPAVLSRRRLGRARRISGDRPRQFGAALSCDLGHRARRARALRPPRARGASTRPRDVPLPPSRDALTTTGGAVDGVQGDVLEPSNAERGRRARARLAGSFALTRAGRDRHVGRHRRQSRSGAASLAEAPRRRAAPHDLRRARACRRPMLDVARSRRRQHHQSRPHVALRRRASRTTRRSGPARHPHPAGPLVAVARRARQAAAGAAVSRLRLRSARSRTSRATGTTIPGSC